MKLFCKLPIIIFLLLLIFCGYSFANTQSPSPNKNKETNSPTNEKSEPPNGNKKKFELTNESPASVKPEITLAANTQNKPIDTHEWEKRNYTSQDKIERYTFWLAVSTVLLFGATSTLCVITHFLRKIARQEFSATHRPKIIVHTFENSINDKGQIGPIFTYVNAGTNDATIIDISSNIFFSDNLRPGAGMKTKDFKKKKIIKPGGVATFLVESDITTTSAIIEDMRKQRGQSNLKILCIGKIRYRDPAGSKRETGFCRKFDSTTSCWLKVENSDYEYSY